ncbi:hypothetical protein V6N11_009356 [Hibiscus sabdariffa]|uniref:Uncharacterized protein n=1 Tax=Hibiscus sabdariffa TaxID=183260 RepID=A0ABR2NSM5_9ROSI
MLSRNQVSGTSFYTFFSSQFIESNGLLLVCHSWWRELSPQEATSVSICESSLVVEDVWFWAIERRGSLGHLTVSSGFCSSVVGELSVEELFLVWRFGRFRKNKFGLLRWFLFGSLVALRYLRWSGFTTISSLSSLFWVKIQMLVFGRRGDEVPTKAKGSCDRRNGEEGAVTVASTKSTVALVNAEGRYHAIYVFGKGYKTRAFSSLLMGNAVPDILHTSASTSLHVSPCRMGHVSLYDWSHESSFDLLYVQLSIYFCKLRSTILKHLNGCSNIINNPPGHLRRTEAAAKQARFIVSLKAFSMEGEWYPAST